MGVAWETIEGGRGRWDWSSCNNDMDYYEDTAINVGIEF